MKSINVFGDIHPELWERQRLSHNETEFIFHYRNFSADASWTIHIGNAKTEFQPNPNSKNIFMFTEPPEIYQYKSDELTRFDIVAGPEFPLYLGLPNYVFSQVALPWSVGVIYPGSNKILRLRMLRKIFPLLPTKKPTISFDINQLLKLEMAKEKFLSIVTSNKVETPIQKKRLEFIRFLSSRQNIPIEIYGHGFRSISDKFEVLSRSSHHLALENSLHKGYWTEKLADSILSLNRTYYVGASDIHSFFPPEVVLPLDLSDFEKAASIIESDFMNFNPGQSSKENARLKLIKEDSFESIILRIIDSSKIH